MSKRSPTSSRGKPTPRAFASSRTRPPRRMTSRGACSTSTTSTETALLQQPPLRRPPRQLVAAGELELAQHRADVRLDGLDRDPQAQRDLLVHVAARDVAQDLALARRELVELGVG